MRENQEGEAGGRSSGKKQDREAGGRNRSEMKEQNLGRKAGW